MRRIPRARLLLALLLAPGAAGCAADATNGQVAVGAPIPAFGAPTLAGDTLALEELRGQVVLVNLWATWCPPCREEMPALQALHEQHHPDGLRVVGVSIDDAGSRADIEEFLQQNGITFTILHDADQSVTNVFRTTGVPETFLVGRDGRLLNRWIGKIETGDERVRGAIEAALGEREAD